MLALAIIAVIGCFASRKLKKVKPGLSDYLVLGGLFKCFIRLLHNHRKYVSHMNSSIILLMAEVAVQGVGRHLPTIPEGQVRSILLIRLSVWQRNTHWACVEILTEHLCHRVPLQPNPRPGQNLDLAAILPHLCHPLYAHCNSYHRRNRGTVGSGEHPRFHLCL